jgi:hypothetical protein
VPGLLGSGLLRSGGGGVAGGCCGGVVGDLPAAASLA